MYLCSEDTHPYLIPQLTGVPTEQREPACQCEWRGLLHSCQGYRSPLFINPSPPAEMPVWGGRRDGGLLSLTTAHLLEVRKSPLNPNHWSVLPLNAELSPTPANMVYFGHTLGLIVVYFAHLPWTLFTWQRRALIMNTVISNPMWGKNAIGFLCVCMEAVWSLRRRLVIRGCLRSFKPNLADISRNMRWKFMFFPLTCMWEDWFLIPILAVRCLKTGWRGGGGGGDVAANFALSQCSLQLITMQRYWLTVKCFYVLLSYVFNTHPIFLPTPLSRRKSKWKIWISRISVRPACPFNHSNIGCIWNSLSFICMFSGSHHRTKSFRRHPWANGGNGVTVADVIQVRAEVELTLFNERGIDFKEAARLFKTWYRCYKIVPRLKLSWRESIRCGFLQQRRYKNILPQNVNPELLIRLCPWNTVRR